MERLSVLVVDDEPPACRKLLRFLAEEPDVDLAGEAGDGAEAVAAIRREAPDLLFLDIRTPGADGFTVLEMLEPAELPQVVFVTAYDQYALRAFDVHALDYLLKPYDQERFRRALARARDAVRRTRAGALDDRLRRLLADLRPAATYLDRLLVQLVNVDRIRELQPWSHGDQVVLLRDGTRLLLSRRYRDRLPGLA